METLSRHKHKTFDLSQVPLRMSELEKLATDPDVLLVLIAGSVCKDWSTMGRQAGFAGSHTALCAIMLAVAKHLDVDLLLHECTQRFPNRVLLD